MTTKSTREFGPAMIVHIGPGGVRTRRFPAIDCESEIEAIQVARLCPGCRGISIGSDCFVVTIRTLHELEREGFEPVRLGIAYHRDGRMTIARR